MIGCNYERYCLISKEKFEKTCSIRLFITNLCNMTCWYCSYHHKALGNTPDLISDELWENVIKFIKLQKKEYIDFTFTGGEPTLHPKLTKYIHRLYSEFKDKINIQVNTNAGLNLKYYQLFFTREKVELLVSFHSQKVKSISKFFEKIEFFERYHDVKVHLMLEKSNIDLIKNIYIKYKKEGFKNPRTYLEIVPITQFIEDPLFKEITWYSEDKDKDHGFLQKIKETADVYPKNEGWLTNKNFKGMMCLGENIITVSGDVYHCYQDMLLKSNSKINLLKEKPKKLQEYKLCKHEQCDDGTIFPKYSIPYFYKK